MQAETCDDRGHSLSAGRQFQEAYSLVCSPIGTIRGDGSGVRAARSVRVRRVEALTTEDTDLVKRVLASVAIVVLVACALMALGHSDPAAWDVAAAGHCFIAPDAGSKWHCVRQCKTLVRSPHIEEVTIAEARRRGGGERWQRPCRICGLMLRFNPAYRAKREEYELQLHETGN